MVVKQFFDEPLKYILPEKIDPPKSYPYSKLRKILWSTFTHKIFHSFFPWDLCFLSACFQNRVYNSINFASFFLLCVSARISFKRNSCHQSASPCHPSGSFSNPASYKPAIQSPTEPHPYPSQPQPDHQNT